MNNPLMTLQSLRDYLEGTIINLLSEDEWNDIESHFAELFCQLMETCPEEELEDWLSDKYD